VVDICISKTPTSIAYVHPTNSSMAEADRSRIVLIALIYRAQEVRGVHTTARNIALISL
jgi:hypothetical protein